MSIAPAETVLERVETHHEINPTSHIWHAKCQGIDPGPKLCYCGHRLNLTGKGQIWDGRKVIAEDCVVCMDLQAKKLCPICSKGDPDA